MLETARLETQMLEHQINKDLAFFSAEAVLKKIGQQIVDGLVPADIHNTSMDITTTLLGKDSCKHLKYNTVVEMKKYVAVSRLESIVVQPNAGKCPQPLPTGEVFWKQG